MTISLSHLRAVAQEVIDAEAIAEKYKSLDVCDGPDEKWCDHVTPATILKLIRVCEAARCYASNPEALEEALGELSP